MGAGGDSDPRFSSWSFCMYPPTINLEDMDNDIIYNVSYLLSKYYTPKDGGEWWGEVVLRTIDAKAGREHTVSTRG